MAGEPTLIQCRPGIDRDGTQRASEYWADGEWVRFQRGKPRKMGGYRAMSTIANGPVRSMLVDQRNGARTAHLFSQWGVQRMPFSVDGAGGGLEDRTPAAFVPNPLYQWSHAILASSTGGTFAALLAASTPDVLDITSDATGPVWTGSMSDNLPLTQLMNGATPLAVSGGVTVLHPFPVVYGSAGLIKIGNPNDLSSTTWTPGGSSLALEANPAGTKIVYGAPVRGGSQSPAGLFWSLDSLIRASFVGGDFLWQFDTLTAESSIMSSKCVVEHDGKFYWPGTDRFLAYNGVVQDLPNQMNSNWFFEGLNYAQRNKVWGTKIPRYGEIWWFYPRGASTECDYAVIFNYLENTWYDAQKTRSAGGRVQVFQYPIWAGGEDLQDTIVLTVGTRLITSAPTAAGNAVLNFTSTAGASLANGRAVLGDGVAPNADILGFTGTTVTMTLNAIGAGVPVGTAITFSSMTNTPFSPGEIVTGATSGATGRVVRPGFQQMNLINVTGTFVNGENLTGSDGGTGTVLAAPFDQQLHTAYQQEYGLDKILGSDVTAIRGSITTKSFGLAIGIPPFAESPKSQDRMTKAGRFDPDYENVTTPVAVELLGRSFTKQPMRVLDTKVLGVDDNFTNFHGQERELQIRTTVNTRGGFFEQGKVFVELEPGDSRSSAPTTTAGSED